MRLYTSLNATDLAEIASDIGVEISTSGNPKPITRGRNAGKTLYTFTLRPDRSTADADGNCRHQRESAGYMSDGRRVHAVCWHGHADFMALVFRADPVARFETAFATYDGVRDFADNYRQTAWRNIGARIAPVAAASACRCGFRDTAGHRHAGVIEDLLAEV
jgi:hypothetical protein